MPVSAMDTAIGDQFLGGTKREVAGFFQAGDVIFSALFGRMAGFVTKSPRWLGVGEEGLFQCIHDLGWIYFHKSESGGTEPTAGLLNQIFTRPFGSSKLRFKGNIKILETEFEMEFL
jgi:hypothetical protein